MSYGFLFFYEGASSIALGYLSKNYVDLTAGLFGMALGYAALEFHDRIEQQEWYEELARRYPIRSSSEFEDKLRNPISEARWVRWFFTGRS
jgi:hypothetical protein